MPKAKIKDIEIEYETFGNPNDKPLLLVNGLGSQMITWEDGFIQLLLDRGFYVIRFDNRDVGLSTKCEWGGEPNIMAAYMAAQAGNPIESPYSLNDMADDAIGVLDALNIEKAHICGRSMGGMIVQVIALRHPTRVLSLTSIMSTTGNPELPRGDPEVQQALVAPVPSEREKVIENGVRIMRLIYGSLPFDEEKAKEQAANAFDRCFYPMGFARQMLAIIASENRRPKLNSITVPTLIIHGSEDPLLPVEGSKDIHEAIPGSKLLIIEGMGHSLPPETWVQMTDAIQANAVKA